jgi:hypothetical protein
MNAPMDVRLSNGGKQERQTSSSSAPDQPNKPWVMQGMASEKAVHRCSPDEGKVPSRKLETHPIHPSASALFRVRWEGISIARKPLSTSTSLTEKTVK